MDFLYFPADKSEYIPGIIWSVVFFVVALLAFRLIKKISEKELLKAKKIEEEMTKTHAEYYSQGSSISEKND